MADNGAGKQRMRAPYAPEGPVSLRRLPLGLWEIILFRSPLGAWLTSIVSAKEFGIIQSELHLEASGHVQDNMIISSYLPVRFLTAPGDDLVRRGERDVCGVQALRNNEHEKFFAHHWHRPKLSHD